MKESKSLFLDIGYLKFELSGLVEDEKFGLHLNHGNFTIRVTGDTDSIDGANIKYVVWSYANNVARKAGNNMFIIHDGQYVLSHQENDHLETFFTAKNIWSARIVVNALTPNEIKCLTVIISKDDNVLCRFTLTMILLVEKGNPILRVLGLKESPEDVFKQTEHKTYINLPDNVWNPTDHEIKLVEETPLKTFLSECKIPETSEDEIVITDQMEKWLDKKEPELREVSFDAILNMSGKPLTPELKALGVVECPEELSELINKELEISDDYLTDLSDSGTLEIRCCRIFDMLCLDQFNRGVGDDGFIRPDWAKYIDKVYLDPEAYQTHALCAAAEDAGFEAMLPVRKNGIIIGLI